MAGPSVSAGDVGLRHDIQVLADYGAIRGPVTTWPMSWDALLAELERTKAEDFVLPNKVIPTYDRVLARAQRETRRGQPAFSASLAGADMPTRIRGFSDTPRARGEVRAGFSWFSEHLSIDLNVAGVDAPVDGEDVRPDGSQVALDVGNWSVAASTLERWWGPGWDGSLILSNNARPFPALTINRNQTHAFESKWLSWIGPWDLSVIFGQLEKERFIPNAQFFGMRINFRPHPAFELGISRSAQWCGDGRPCGFDVFADLLLGKDNIGDAGVTEENEPGNQMAGFDVRWTNLWFGTPISLYGQMIGEDEAGGFPSRYLAQFGIEGSGITQGRRSYRWFAELSGTSCDFVKSAVRYNCAYNNGIYQSGYRYRGRIIGHGLDNDARVVSAGIVVAEQDGSTWQVLARSGDLNRDGGFGNNTVAPVAQKLASLDLEYNRMTKFGQFQVGLGYERIEDVASSTKDGTARAFLRWQSR